MTKERPYRLFGTTTEGLSRGPGAKQFNPLLLVEMRRWRARPFTYAAFVIIALAGILLNRYLNSSVQTSILAAIGLQFPTPDLFSQFIEGQQNFLLNFPFGELIYKYLRGFNNLNYLMHSYISLLLRPSTVVPLLMVWRALITFRESGYYNSLRMTFLHQRDFIWGLVTIPFWISAVILVFYVGLVLSPNLIQRYYAVAPDERVIHPMWNIAGILFEGAANGALICFLALYLGLRKGATLLNVFPIIAFILVIQFIMALYLVQPAFINELLFPFPESWNMKPDNRELSPIVRSILANVNFLVMGVPKLIACVVLYQMSLRLLARGSDMEVTAR